MKIVFVQITENGVGTIDFETKNDGMINFVTYSDKTVRITANDVTLDEVLEAIEIVKSGKLVIEL